MELPLIGLNFLGILDKGSEILEIKPITGCNAGCNFCSVNEGFGTNKEIDFVVDKDYLVNETKVLLSFKQTDNISLWLNPHGDPTLYSKLVEYCEEIIGDEHVKDIHIITNGFTDVQNKKMKILGNEIKPGMIIEHRNDLWSVLKAQHVKPGKGGAFNQVELKSVKKGTKLNERFRSSDSIERAVLDEKKFNFLYEDENNCHFMDQTNFEQIAINKSLLGEKNKLLKENMAVNVHFYEDQALSVDLPSSVELTITNTDATIKGQTASSSYKPATLENGINIMVPPFINSGDKIILDTSTLEYIKKIK